MSFSELEEKVLTAIECYKQEICEIGEYLQKIPELGYREVKTSAFVQDIFNKFEIPYENGLAVTGVKGILKGRETAPWNIAVIGELDAVICKNSTKADPLTGAVHACGHHAQLAAMLGVAIGLSKSGIMQDLSGNVVFLAVPAEEYIDLEFRRNLQKEGKIKFLGGKQQLISEGVFKEIDAAMMVHAQPNTPDAKVFLHGSSLGFVEKQIEFKGKEAHASEPYKGINALNAAALAILGMHVNRECFKEEDKIRVHTIITNGGDVINSVPNKVCMEGYVRGASTSAIQEASEATDRAILGAAQMVGAEAEIKTSQGYAPLKQNYKLGEIFREVSELFVPSKNIYTGIDMVGSTDMGDLSQMIPCIQPTMGGFDGELHGREFKVTNSETAYVLPAKIMALTVVRLLSNNGELVKKIKEEQHSCGQNKN